MLIRWTENEFGNKFKIIGLSDDTVERILLANSATLPSNSLKESMEIDRNGFVSLVKYDTYDPKGNYAILNDGNFVKAFWADNDDEAKEIFNKKDESLKESTEKVFPTETSYKVYEIEDYYDETDDWEEAIAQKLKDDFGCNPIGFDYDEENGEVKITDISWKVEESLKESADPEWRSVCREYCRQNGYTLLFVNEDSFGYEDKNGNMIHKYVDELVREFGGRYEESLKESVNKKEVIDAIIANYGCTKKEAEKQFKEMSDKRKELLVKGFKDNAKKAFLNDSLKESSNAKDYDELFIDFLDVTEFSLEKYDDGYGLIDRQGANLGDIESDRFNSAAEIVDRMDVYITDYFLNDDEYGDYVSFQDFLDNGPKDIPERPIVDMLVNHIDEVNLDRVWDRFYKQNESLTEDTVKQGNAWVNKGKEGTHGKFKTKKAADAQRKAMFANGHKVEALEEGYAFNTAGKSKDSEEILYQKLKERVGICPGCPIWVVTEDTLDKNTYRTRQDLKDAGAKVCKADYNWIVYFTDGDHGFKCEKVNIQNDDIETTYEYNQYGYKYPVIGLTRKAVENLDDIVDSAREERERIRKSNTIDDSNDRFSATAHEDNTYDSPVFSIESGDFQKIISFAWHMIQQGLYIFVMDNSSKDFECIAPDEILNSGDAKEKLERRMLSIIHDESNSNGPYGWQRGIRVMESKNNKKANLDESLFK